MRYNRTVDLFDAGGGGSYDPREGRTLQPDYEAIFAGHNAYVGGNLSLLLASPRFWGAVTLIGGALEAAGGAIFGLVTAETGVGAVVGFGVFLHGLDTAMAGAKQLISGKEQRTLTSQGIEAFARVAGADEKQAYAIGEAADMAIGLAGANVWSRIGRAGSIAAGMNRFVTHGNQLAVAGVAVGSVRGTRVAGGIQRGATILAHFKSAHDQYAEDVLGSAARQREFATPWSEGRKLGTRRVDGYDPRTATIFEANTTPWAQWTEWAASSKYWARRLERKVSHKLEQLGSDLALLDMTKSGRRLPGQSPVRRVIWFGTEELPKVGPAARLREAIEKSGIPYYVVRTRC